MNRIKLLISIGLALLAGVINSKADDFSQFAGGGTFYPGSATYATNWVVIPAEAAAQFNNSQGRTVKPNPVITWLAVRNISASDGVLTSYYSTNGPIVLTTNNNAASIYVNVSGTNGITPPCWAVLHHQGLNEHITDEGCYITALPGTVVIGTNTFINAGTTNYVLYTNVVITVAAAPLNTGNSNDLLYIETPLATQIIASAVPTTENTFTGPGLVSGSRGKPFLLTLTGITASTNFIDGVNANFVP